MLYAEVSVNSPAAGRNTYSYQVPAGLNVRPGQSVLVPFGQKTLQGIVVETGPKPHYDETRPLAGLTDPLVYLTEPQLTTGLFISHHYLAPLFESLALWLPPGFERQAEAIIRTAAAPEAKTALSPAERNVLRQLAEHGEIEQKALEKQLGKTAAARAVRHLLENGLIDRRYRLQPAKVKPRLEQTFYLNTDPDNAQTIADSLAARAPKQSRILSLLANCRGVCSARELRRMAGDISAALTALTGKGLVRTVNEESRRVPRLPADMELPVVPPLTEAQERAVKAVTGAMDEAGKDEPPVFLLHGVTGSGKTEIYLHTTAHALSRGRQVMVLVPEIALTHQIIERFTARFPGKVAVLHSRLSLGERFDQWRAIAEGEYPIVIGPRSALFAPTSRPGLIIMDEEHEWAYKQQDTPPLYHARTVARRLAAESGAVLLLGSATPDVESYYRATAGRYRLLEMPQRLTPHANAPLPPVSLIDMRQELKSGNLSIFSRKLTSEMTEALHNNEQIILFYNRRGGATFIQCRDCGEVIKCRNCRLPLGYHPAEKRLVCHHCNTRSRIPETCPACGGRRIKYLGLGTQKLEEETRQAFPGARVLRWDSDAIRGKDSGYQIFSDFRSGNADILIGTQVVARGLDLPGVSLVGVVNADTALNLPDFRAGERTFQLLAQVAGRAGRGEAAGRVVIQSYQPEHYAVSAAVGHDYDGFYRQEIGYRQMLGYPPFGELAVLTLQHTDEEKARQAAQALRSRLETERDARGISGITVIGPAPAFVPRRRGRYRWQLIIKGRKVPDFLHLVQLPSGMAVDVDPLGLD